MTLYDFFSEYLPDFKKKLEAMDRIYGKGEKAYYICYSTYLNEALQNFANQICKKQRENCAIDFYGTAKESIRNAEQPKISEL